MVKNRLAILNDVFGYDREPYARDEQGNIKGNHGTFIIDSAYGGYRLSQMACPDGGTGERDLSQRGTARQTYDIINAWIDAAERNETKAGVRIMTKRKTQFFAQLLGRILHTKREKSLCQRGNTGDSDWNEFAMLEKGSRLARLYQHMRQP